MRRYLIKIFEFDEMLADACRYRWLKSRNGLSLYSEKLPNTWTRSDGSIFTCSHCLSEGGTQHAPGSSLDEIIDNAMSLRR